MARPRSADPKRPLTLALNQSVLDALTAQAAVEGVSPGQLGASLLTHQLIAGGKVMRSSPLSIRERACNHPVLRRVGVRCGACGDEVA